MTSLPPSAKESLMPTNARWIGQYLLATGAMSLLIVGVD